MEQHLIASVCSPRGRRFVRRYPTAADATRGQDTDHDTNMSCARGAVAFGVGLAACLCLPVVYGSAWSDRGWIFIAAVVALLGLVGMLIYAPTHPVLAARYERLRWLMAHNKVTEVPREVWDGLYEGAEAAGLPLAGTYWTDPGQGRSRREILSDYFPAIASVGDSGPERRQLGILIAETELVAQTVGRQHRAAAEAAFGDEVRALLALKGYPVT